MKKPLLFIFVFFLGLMASDYAYSQKRRKGNNKKNYKITHYRGGRTAAFGKSEYLSVGLTVSSFNYFGDLAPETKITSTDLGLSRLGIGVTGTKRFGPQLSLRAGFTWGRLTGDDFEAADPSDVESGRFRYQRNLQFRNDIKELSLIAVFDIIRNDGGYLSRVPFTPYVFAGIAGFHHNPKGLAPDFDSSGAAVAEAGQWVDLEPLGTEGQHSGIPSVSTYGKIQAAVPFGLGARVRLNDQFDLGLEVGYRYLFFDHIDDVSDDYVDGLSGLAQVMAYRSGETKGVVSGDTRTVFGNDSNNDGFIDGFGRAGDQRGDAGDNDQYVITSIHIKYVIGASSPRKAKFR